MDPGEVVTPMASSRMAPPLPDDLILDILLSLPPDDPAGLVRASAVCKAWRLIITDPAFLGRYRALHPSFLGFLHNLRSRPASFVSTKSFRAAAPYHCQYVLDCGHGRAVFYDYSDVGYYVVGDPATGELHKLPDVPCGHCLEHPTVFCADSGVGGCDDHRGCSGGSYIVAFVGVAYVDDYDEKNYHCEARACFYESDTGKMTGEIDINLGYGEYSVDHDRPAALVGDSLYYLCWPGILQYRYGLLRRLGTMGMILEDIRSEDVLSMMELPRWERLGIGKNTKDVVVMAAEGGGLGLACLCPEREGTKLYLMARETAEGTVVWPASRFLYPAAYGQPLHAGMQGNASTTPPPP